MDRTPPDPFGPLALDMGASAQVQMFNALRNNGASRVDAALMTAMLVVLNGMVTDQTPRQ